MSVYSEEIKELKRIAKEKEVKNELRRLRRENNKRQKKRMREIWEYGATPFAMLYRDEKGKTTAEWRKFQRQFARPAISHSILKGKTEVER